MAGLLKYFYKLFLFLHNCLKNKVIKQDKTLDETKLKWMIIYVEQNVNFKSKILNFKKTGTEKRKLKKK